MYDTASLLLEGSRYTPEKKGRVRSKLSVIRGYDVPRFEPVNVQRGISVAYADYRHFQSLEELMTSILSSDIDDTAKDAARQFDLLTAGGNVANLGVALQKFEQVMKAAFTDNTERLVHNALEKLMEKGANVAGLEGGLRDTLSKNDLIDSMQKSAKFYTNEQFSRNVLPEIYGQLDDIYKLNLSPTETLTTIRDLAMDGLTKEDWRLKITANGAASKAYHYGVVKGGWDAGFRTYEFVAIEDEKTSDICMEMDGKRFQLASAINVAEKRTGGEPEDVAESSPWFSADDIDDKTNAELVAMGCLIPPLHANCRSSIKLS